MTLPSTTVAARLTRVRDQMRALSIDAFVITHLPNLPSEEVFTTPDPERADGEGRTVEAVSTRHVRLGCGEAGLPAGGTRPGERDPVCDGR